MSELCSIRECSDAVRAVIEENRDNKEALRTELLEAVRAFITRPDLFELGVKRPGNHIDNSKYIYYDGELSITLDELPKDMVVPPHDHGPCACTYATSGEPPLSSGGRRGAAQSAFCRGSVRSSISAASAPRSPRR